MRLLLIALFTALPVFAQYKMQTPAGEAPGPWLFGTIGVGRGQDGQPLTTALKGLAIKLGENGEAGIAYDLDLGRVAGVWTGGKFVTPMNLMSRGEYPVALGKVLGTTPEAPGFALPSAASWSDPRPEPFGPLPPGQIRFQGLHVQGGKTVLQWDIGGVEVREMPLWREGQVVRVFQGPAQPVPISGVTVESATALPVPAGTAHWPEAITTTATLSADATSAYVVDTVKLPDSNPWGAPMFLGGFDFFPDGRAAVCTFHGDVFLVSGLEGELGAVQWRRFASGLYHPLGLKIAGGEIYVTCRDGLYRLRDAHGDGEADFYEAFNYDLKVTKNFHEFVFDLHTDAAGNFYFAKAGPVRNGGQGFEQIMAHHGTLLRVSPDGAKLDVVATGFRAPNGIGVGPRGELTSGDNEGTWTPACKINWITPGAFCGVVPLAHRDPPPTDYARPLCWLPKRVDNSGGSQVWVPDDDHFGPWRGQMLHLSYGKAALYGVLRETVGGVTQGGVVRFPLKFDSGIMRARFHPKDGTLWVAGLRGWQTDGLKNGCLQRVRYTGQPARLPIALHARRSGLEVRFTESLETSSAADPENWQVEAWNYAWTSAYGSPELSPRTEQRGHDALKVRAIHVGTDDRSVTLEIEELAPVMQMAIKYRIKTADGAPLEGEIVHTIHALGE